MNKKIQIVDLHRQYDRLKTEIDAGIQEVIRSGAYINGPVVSEFAGELSSYLGVKHTIPCANGTDALTLALKAWNIGPGDAVFVPDFTFFASAEAVSLEGAVPVFVDVDPDTFNINPVRLKEAIDIINEKGELTPKVIVTVDLFGLPADYAAIRRIADQYKLYILEDGAQGFGGAINGKKACSFGDISTTSFFPAKPLGCYGDGGAIFTDNDEWAGVMQSLAFHGKGSFKYDNVRIGVNSRLDSIQAAILKVKLKAFIDFELETINNIASRYTEKLKDVVKTPVVPEGYYSSWAQYTLVLKDEAQRDGLRDFLNENSIPTMIYYPKPMHKQTAYKENPCVLTPGEVTKRLCKTVLSLPIHPYLTGEEVEMISDRIVEYLKN